MNEYETDENKEFSFEDKESKFTFQNLNNSIMCKIDAVGKVEIDWNAVEEALQHSDRLIRSYARLIQAIRDNDYHSLKQRQE